MPLTVSNCKAVAVQILLKVELMLYEICVQLSKTLPIDAAVGLATSAGKAASLHY